MKQLNFAFIIGATLLLCAFTTYKSIDWQISDGYSIAFKGTEVEGVFNKLSGSISFDEDELSNSKFSVNVDVSSINTGNGLKNKHAISDKWFNAPKFPNITFNSTKFSKTETGGYQVEGILEIHGVKKQISFPFTFSSNTFKGGFKVNRMDYNVGTMDGMSKKVSNEIEIEFSVPVKGK